MKRPTPGPWIAQPDPDCPGDGYVIGVADGTVDAVATCSERDALLIAAAPDLLEAAFAVDQVIQQNLAEAMCVLNVNVVRQLRNAMFKATGT